MGIVTHAVLENHQDLRPLAIGGPRAARLFDRHAVDRYLGTALPDPRGRVMRRLLMRIAYGELRAEGGRRVRLVPTGLEPSPTSHLLDEEVWSIVADAAQDLGEAASSTERYDAWAEARGVPDSAAIRLRLAVWSWRRLVAVAAEPDRSVVPVR